MDCDWTIHIQALDNQDGEEDDKCVAKCVLATWTRCSGGSIRRALLQCKREHGSAGDYGSQHRTDAYDEKLH